MIKLLKNLNKKDLPKILLILFLVIIQVWLELKLPDYMSEITSLVKTEGSPMSLIIENGIYMLLCAFGSLISAIFCGYITTSVSSNFSMTLRDKLFEKVQNLSMNEVKKFSTSSLITRTTNDVTQIEMLISVGLQLLLKAPIMAIWAITKILNKSFKWSITVVIAVVILLLVIVFLMITVVPKFKIVQKLIDKLNGVIRENITGIRIIRAFNAENYQENKFEKVNNDLTKLQLFNQKTFAIMSPIMYLVMNGLTLSIYLIGANLIDGALMEDKIVLFGDMVVFSSYAMQIIMSFLMLAMIFMILPRAGVSASRINEVLDSDISVKNGTLKENKTNLKGTIEFKNVSFKYPDAEEYLLKNISFKINQGETVAFIGSTGSGKSTLINLIPRFYDVTEGEILIDGINVKEYDLKYLYNKIGYISQKAVLFSGTIKSNVAYGNNNISLDKVKEAIEIAQGNDFVLKLENKYDSEIAQRGTNLSGGQKQRLSIARAIAKDPEIYIFDDSFSALDYKTDSNLRKELKKYTSKATTLIVAQRIGTIMNSDKIIVLDEGKIASIGKHNELLKNCDVYRQIAESQLSKEELENA